MSFALELIKRLTAWRTFLPPPAWFVIPWILGGMGCGPAQPMPTSASTEEAPITITSPLPLLNLTGEEVDPFKTSEGKWLVFVFVSVDCPISNRYAPEIQRLHQSFASKGVTFWLVHPNADETPEAIRKHTADYRYACGVLRDPKHLLAKRAGATVVPEAALLDRAGRLLYRGRIDNRFVEPGKERPEATERDLEIALTAAVQGKPVLKPRSRAVGCYISGEP